MTKPNTRLHFLDAIRSFAIIMMLQGHFVHALLDNCYRDKSNFYYSVWEYFRGITAPTFFTITGFIFTFLLLKQKTSGFENPRVFKGIKRALKLILWGYLLRLSIFAIFSGTVNPSFFYVDVLQCIGMSLLLLILLYLVFSKINYKVFQFILLLMGVTIFIMQPLFDSITLPFLPEIVENYFTKINGSIFTLIPWFGYVCFGGFLAITFLRYGKQSKFYPFIITVLLISGFTLINLSSDFMMFLYNMSYIQVFKSVAYNNYLFTRLGNVSLIFAIFIWLRNYLTLPVFTNIGGKTLSIYIVHFFVLYGSWFGFGLNRFFALALNPEQVMLGAILFVVGICFSISKYDVYKSDIIRVLYQINIPNLSRVKNVNLPSFMKNTMIRRYQDFRLGKR